MPNVDVKKLLSPSGPEVREAHQGARNAALVAVAAYWPEIEEALNNKLTVTAVYRILSKAGLVSVTRQAFARQVKARREGAGTAAKPAGEVLVIENPEGPAPANKADSRPLPKWMTVPYEDPDPKALFKERDPLVDD